MPRRTPVMKRIREIEYSQIDRVGAGAQPDAHVTLVKARRVPISKLTDPESIDAKIQAVRSVFWEQFNQAGCCYDCAGWVYVDAVYDGFLIGCDDDGAYWRIPYEIGAQNAVTFSEPEAVFPSVSWSAGTAEADDAPTPITKAAPLWARPGERPTFFTKSEFDKTKEEHPMPAARTPVKKETAVAEAPDLTALDDETRTAVEAALAERDELAAGKAEFDAAVAAIPEPEPEGDEDDLSTAEGLQKAIKKSRGPNRELLQGVLTQLQKSQAEATEAKESAAKLQKAERVRLFKERAAEVPRMAAHAAAAGADGIGALAGLMETIDSECGSETAEAVEAILTKSNAQIHELMEGKGLLKSVGRHAGEPGKGGAIVAADDPVEKVDELAADLMKEHPDLSLAQARVRVLKARPELYAEAISQ